MKFFKKVFIIILFIFSFQKSFALIISEIQFDPSVTSDTEGEWIEVFNESENDINIQNFYFNDGSSDKKVLQAESLYILYAKEYAIIARNIDGFKKDISPKTFSGKIFTVSGNTFGLSNSGEKISIKDSSLKVVDEVDFNPSQTGSGSGKTEQKVAGSWGAGDPTPGYENKIEIKSEENESTENPNLYKPNYYTKSSWPTSEKVYIQAGENTITLPEKKIFFLPKIIDSNKSPLTCDSYNWSFGDGQNSLEKEPFHSYFFVGEYTVFLECKIKNSTIKDYFFVKVIEPEISLSVTASDLGIILELKNNTEDIIDLGSLYIKDEETKNVFILPKNFSILQGRSIKLDPSLTKFSTSSNSFVLYLSSGRKVSEVFLKNSTTTNSILENSLISVLSKEDFDKLEKEKSLIKNVDTKTISKTFTSRQNISNLQSVAKTEIKKQEIPQNATQTKIILSKPKAGFLQSFADFFR
jgi:hypothetical protein